jgi:2-oxo-3-hexenedioate decarboxylase
MNKSIKEIADILDHAALNSQTTQQVSLSQAISLEESYEIQKVSLENRLARGEKLTGYKLGFTSKAKMEQMGVHDIIWGRLTDGMQYESGQAA